MGWVGCDPGLEPETAGIGEGQEEGAFPISNIISDIVGSKGPIPAESGKPKLAGAQTSAETAGTGLTTVWVRATGRLVAGCSKGPDPPAPI
ncbi:hypothetical protein DPEC_G00331730 [Dallia pectoralis]|uniref:Uncharacterized protein n=1 Tax=Dallia pectoralis TaxID=75939 RepID=A0ACC2F6A1_DALPE|nr:hypothetical protein DPEC_G00331730 [Dallia pectoralis]